MYYVNFIVHIALQIALLSEEMLHNYRDYWAQTQLWCIKLYHWYYLGIVYWYIL